METALNDFTKWKADDSVSNPERHNNVTKAHFQGRQGKRKTKQNKPPKKNAYLENGNDYLVWSTLKSRHIFHNSVVISTSPQGSAKARCN